MLSSFSDSDTKKATALIDEAIEKETGFCNNTKKSGLSPQRPIMADKDMKIIALENLVKDLQKQLQSIQSKSQKKSRKRAKSSNSTSSDSCAISTANQFTTLMDTDDTTHDITPPPPPSPSPSSAPSLPSSLLSASSPAIVKINVMRTKADATPKAVKRKTPTTTSSTPLTKSQTTNKTSEKTPSPAPIKTGKPPPIVVKNMDYKVMSSLLFKEIGRDMFSFRRINGNTTHIVSKTMDAFKAIRTCIQTRTNAEHHTFTPKEEQYKNIVLRYLDESYNIDDVSEAINELNLDVTVHKVMRLPTPNTLWLIQLSPGSNEQQLLAQKFLLHQNIRFEHKYKQGVVQCKNCQSYGHSAANCNHVFRCVKCTETHKPGQCPRTLNPELAEKTPPTCVNCKEHHTANFRKCPFLINILQKKQAAQRPAIKTPHTSITTATRVNGITFANALAPPQTPPVPRSAAQSSQPKSLLDFFEAECQKHFKTDFSSLQQKMKDFYPTYLALPTQQQPFALMNLAMSLN